MCKDVLFIYCPVGKYIILLYIFCRWLHIIKNCGIQQSSWTHGSHRTLPDVYSTYTMYTLCNLYNRVDGAQAPCLLALLVVLTKTITITVFLVLLVRLHPFLMNRASLTLLWHCLTSLHTAWTASQIMSATQVNRQQIKWKHLCI